MRSEWRNASPARARLAAYRAFSNRFTAPEIATLPSRA